MRDSSWKLNYFYKARHAQNMLNISATIFAYKYGKYFYTAYMYSIYCEYSIMYAEKLLHFCNMQYTQKDCTLSMYMNIMHIHVYVNISAFLQSVL